MLSVRLYSADSTNIKMMSGNFMSRKRDGKYILHGIWEFRSTQIKIKN
jgi:hypothetical protein